MDILIIDNNDSFTRNLEHLLVESIAGSTVRIEPYAQLDKMDLAWPDLVVISPGPGSPEDYPGYERVVEARKPVLGICLGMQILNGLRGGRTGRLEGCVHGKAEEVQWQGESRRVARYHSLHIIELGQHLDLLASNNAGVPMVIGDPTARLLGYQFHPESFLTTDGGRFVSDALAYLGLD